MFGFFRRRRRKKLMRQPFPSAWDDCLIRNVHHYERLTAAEQDRLRRHVLVFVAEKNWEGCGGQEMNDEIKVTVAAQACLLCLGFSYDEFFDSVMSVLVYPTSYLAPKRMVAHGGLVTESEEGRAGEAWYRGPVILSWEDTLAGGRGELPGNNLVLHEFAHQLDMQDGADVDGTPWLATKEQYSVWQQVMTGEFERLQYACEHGLPTVLDCYGTTNMGEFFAVATECFFELPVEMAEYHPQLYDILQQYYRQDPAER